MTARSAVAIGRVASLEIVDRREHSAGDRYRRLLVTAMAHDAPVACGQRTTPVANRAERRLREGFPEPGVAPAGLARAKLAGALVVAGAERRPTCQVTRS